MSFIVVEDKNKSRNLVGCEPETELFWTKYNGRVKADMRVKLHYFDSEEAAIEFVHSGNKSTPTKTTTKLVTKAAKGKK